LANEETEREEIIVCQNAGVWGLDLILVDKRNIFHNFESYSVLDLRWLVISQQLKIMVAKNVDWREFVEHF
jgi:hypothetical protein